MQFLPIAGALEQRFSYVLYDLHRTSESSIGGGARTRSALLALKYAAMRLSAAKTKVLFDSLGRLVSEEHEFRRATLGYLLEKRDLEEEQLIFTEFEESGYTELREDAMTIAEALRKRGRAEGRVESLVDLYVARFGEIGDRERELISTVADEARLRAALREIVLPEATPESVLGKLQ